MSDAQREQGTTLPLHLAFAAHLKSAHGLLQAWRQRQPAEKQRQLGELVDKGLRLGLSVNMPRDRFVVQVFMLDAAGETVLLDTLEQSGPVPRVN